MAGDEGWAEPVEIIDGEASSAEIAGGRDVDWHRTVRTGAAVVGALALLWIGRSMAQERDHIAESQCSSDVGNVLYRYENAASRMSRGGVGDPPIPFDIAEELIERVRGCGDELLADALQFEYITSYEDDG